MLYKEFQEDTLSQLGFGTMRLPLLENGEIDEAQVIAMTDYAMSHGVNYFDTAYPYHGGKSEIVIAKALEKYPRESYRLADKYPGHQIVEKYNPEEVFEDQLKKCKVEYFDYYLLHNVYENSIDVYLDEQWGILDYFIEQKRLGRIKHLGFSTHGRLELMEQFLEAAGEHMEFCQIQLNWLDWTLQKAKEKVELLNKWNIPVWVMEPVRGGKLCKLEASEEAKLKVTRPTESVPAWGFRFLQDISGVTMILSGMSDMKQMQENIATFEEEKPLTKEEKATLLTIAEELKKSVPCTTCRYCVEQCPLGLDIPQLIATYNELQFAAVTNSAMWLEGVETNKHPSACLACGKCAKMCPQFIDIPQVMRDLTKKLETVPKWADICKEREAIAKAMLNQNK